MAQKASALSCDVLICTGKILSNIPVFHSPSITSHSHTWSASFSLKGKWFSVSAWGSVSGDGSCSLFQKHQACVHTSSNNSFTWSKLDKGLKRVHEECWTKWLQIGRSRASLFYRRFLHWFCWVLRDKWEEQKLSLLLFGVQISNIALLRHTSNNLHGEVSISVMPLPQIAYTHEIRSVSVCTSFKTHGQALRSSSTPFFAEV